MTTHTKGPWEKGKADFGSIVSPHIKTLNGGYIIASTYGVDALTNARLIAASPDMFSALEAVIDWWEECENDGQVVPGHIQAAYAALKRAKQQ